MTIEQRRHAELISRLDALSAAVVALCEAIRGKAEDEEGEDDEYGCEAIRPVLLWDAKAGEVVTATM